jgi:hypothetical protein
MGDVGKTLLSNSGQRISIGVNFLKKSYELNSKKWRSRGAHPNPKTDCSYSLDDQPPAIGSNKSSS